MKCPKCAVYKTAMWRAMKEIRNYVFGDQDGGVQKAYRHLEIAHDAGVLLNAEPAADPRPLPRCPECGADLWTEDENRGHCETCAAREPKNLAAAPSPLTSVLPSDDDEPISNEWFKQTFGGYFIEFPEDEWREMWIYHGTPDVIELGLRDKRAVHGLGGEVHYQLKHLKTRGDLRRLLAALGYRREG